MRLAKQIAARALADAVGIVEQDDATAALREIDRQRQPDGARANHDHSMLGHVRPTRP